jgi:hypothetical protein
LGEMILSVHRRIHHPFGPGMRPTGLAFSPNPTPPGVDPLIKAQTNRIHLGNRSIEMRLVIPMRPKTLHDIAFASPFGPQLHRLEVRYILRIEKHVPYRHRLLVDFERVAGEDDAFGDDAVG